MAESGLDLGRSYDPPATGSDGLAMFPSSITSSVNHLRAALCLGLCVIGSTPLRATDAVQYRLGAQDRLRIHVYEWPALTGEFTVGADGLISLPLIGDVPVSGLQPADLAQEISTRLRTRAGLSEPPNTAVGVAQYRPYYIIGSVERSGEYAYRPGMLVLNAVSIAGGAYRRPDAMTFSVVQERLKTEGELPILTQKSRELAARETRLKAEIAWLEKPAAIGGAEAAPETAPGLSGSEQSMLRAQRGHQQSELRALQQSITLHQDEIVSLKGQREATEKLRQSVLRELAEVRDLIVRGLTATSRVLPLERTLAQIEREQKEFDTLALRARQNINTAERTLATVRSERTVAALRDLLETQTQITETNGRIASAERIVRESLAQAGEGTLSARGEPTVHFTFSVVRVEDGETREFEAFETTPVLPGDILKVQLQRREGSTPAMAQTRPPVPRVAEEARAKRTADVVR
ncbi:hypothetical protein ASF52_15930 [Methylobacterium sp. Leaf112]|nr:hypothetical protein ASF52_15930 [Methylobacterium sp. Leaf112]